MESETSKRLINRLRQLREDRGLTQEGLAERAGLMYKHYQAVEAGRKPDLRLSTLEKLANGLGLEPWELLLPATMTPAVGEAQVRYGRKRARSRRNK